MDALLKQVRTAQRQLNLQTFAATLIRCWAVTLALAAGLVALDKYVSWGLEWWAWPAAALVVGLLAAWGWTWWRRRAPLDAAVEIDRRFGLKERVSSCLALSPEERETPCGQALVADASARVARLDVGERFSLQFNRWALAPVAPALAAFVLGVFWQPSWGGNTAGASTLAQAQRQQIKRSTESLQKRLEEQRKKAEEQGLEDAQELMQQLQRGAEELKQQELGERKDALVKLNDLADQIRERREQLGDAQQVKKMLDQLKGLDRGPADRMADAMRKGDFKAAQQELEKLKDQMKNGQLDQAQQEQLAKQLDQMAEKLKQAADAQEQRKQQLADEVKRQREAGNAAEADRLEQQLRQLEKQCSQCQQQAGAMGQKLKQAAQSMQQGDMAQAADQLAELADDLQQMAQENDEMELLDDAMQQLADAKGQMGCKQCQGQGCAHCQGGKDAQQGDGQGNGRGQGDRPEAKDDARYYDSQVRQKVGRGAALVTDQVDGPNAKGRVVQEIQAELAGAAAGETDPVADQPLPRGVRDHVRGYFEGLREGQP